MDVRSFFGYCSQLLLSFLFFNYTATTEIYTYCHTLSLHDALPIFEKVSGSLAMRVMSSRRVTTYQPYLGMKKTGWIRRASRSQRCGVATCSASSGSRDRKSTRLNSSH